MIRLILEWNSEGCLSVYHASIFQIIPETISLRALLHSSSCSWNTAVLCLGWSWQQLGTTLLSEFSSQFRNAILLEIPKSLNPATYTAGCKISLSQLSAESSGVSWHLFLWPLSVFLQTLQRTGASCHKWLENKMFSKHLELRSTVLA